MRKKASKGSHRGFTLIEIMIVIAIIAILVAIVLAVGGALAGSQNVKRTEASMQILERAVDEFELLMRRDITWGIDFQLPDGSIPAGPYEPKYDMQEATPHVFLVSDLLDNISRSSDIRTMLAQLDQNRYYRYEDPSVTGSEPEWIREGTLATFQATEPDPLAGQWGTELANAPWFGKHTVLDAWDRPIRVIHPGRPHDPNDLIATVDDDGTVRTPYEDQYGIARNARVLFISGGPDGRFGDISAADGTPMKEATRDNIYSYEVE
jgi:prepilin-type N-terminal cleavage/methylation domain-containing protein